jgi:hypothetical protein
MMKKIEKEFNALTGETTITERNETAQEQAQRETFEAELIQQQAEAESKAAAKAALLIKLGITAEEAQLLLGGN